MNTQIVYKKVNIYADGSLHPLFIDTQREFRIGEWMHCEYHPTKGFAHRTVVPSSESSEVSLSSPIGGWHCCYQPVAPHLADQVKGGHRRVWLKCEARGAFTRYERPWNQGGAWILVEWIKPLAVLSDDEVNSLTSNFKINS